MKVAVSTKRVTARLSEFRSILGACVSGSFKTEGSIPRGSIVVPFWDYRIGFQI